MFQETQQSQPLFALIAKKLGVLHALKAKDNWFVFHALVASIYNLVLVPTTVPSDNTPPSPSKSVPTAPVNAQAATLMLRAMSTVRAVSLATS